MASRYHEIRESYEGNEYGGHQFDEIELAEVPKSHTRAPNYASSSKDHFCDGTEDVKASLIQHARTPSGFSPPKHFDSPPRHLDNPLEGLDNIQSITSTLRSTKKKKWSGWHFGVRISAWTAGSVLIMNLILTIFAASKWPVEEGVGTAYEGSCDVVNKWTNWLHIVINILSSLLLSASNYTMQALSAPTRQEVDRAHAKGDWMDIGVASVRNLFKIKWTRVLLWWILAVSSIPIHLLYNSAVFKTIDANEYVMATVNPQWLLGGNFSGDVAWNNSPINTDGYPYNVSLPSQMLPDVQKFFVDNQGNQSLIQRLSNTECIQAYGTNYVSGRNHVLTITSENGTTANETLFMADHTYSSYYSSDLSYSWMCWSSYDERTTSRACDPGTIRQNSDNWIINGKKIDYCLSQIMPPHCELQFSVQVLIAVIICNVLKSGAMLYTLYFQKETTLVTIGDAVASYLEEPDPLTKGRCMMARTDAKTWKSKSEAKPDLNPLPVTYHSGKRKRWFRAASKGRWITTYTLVIIALITVGSLLGLGVETLKAIGADPFKLAFGAIDSRALIESGLPQDGASGLVSSILLANCPQAICSFLYLLYNSLLTSLLLAKEWSQYAFRRKPLRVTTPYGEQRSTYYLQLPFRYSAPLLCISALLHWVISQSIFLARINTYYDGEKSLNDNVSQVGYSCPPILVALMIGLVLLFAAVILGFRRFSSQMPVASSCSVAIAAACHRPKDDLDAAYLPVQWGEVASERTDEMGHCCFTSHPVEQLTSGRMYAAALSLKSSETDGKRRRYMYALPHVS